MVAGLLSVAQTAALTERSYPPPGAGPTETLTGRPLRASNVVAVAPDTFTLWPPTMPPVKERQRDLAAGLDDMVRAARAKNHTDSNAHHQEKPTGS